MDSSGCTVGAPCDVPRSKKRHNKLFAFGPTVVVVPSLYGPPRNWLQPTAVAPGASARRRRVRMVAQQVSCEIYRPAQVVLRCESNKRCFASSAATRPSFRTVQATLRRGQLTD
mmetsp:Transcript_13246/g.35169  ORF Transcript_13246/g.35169 Transcript_13246/m.35169 type:complete len:114 (-) Transcript_13246:76-417(-)